MLFFGVFIWEWIYAKQIAPRDTRGALGGFRGLLGSCPIGTNFGSRLRIHLGMDIGQIQVAPQYPRGHLGGGGRVSQIQKHGEAVKRQYRLAPNFAHICRSIWKWTYAKQIVPRYTRGQDYKHFSSMSRCSTHNLCSEMT